ncbi:MAG: hypothetical protein ACQKBT_02785 [Puniceicoccales bacterium]
MDPNLRVKKKIEPAPRHDLERAPTPPRESSPPQDKSPPAEEPDEAPEDFKDTTDYSPSAIYGTDDEEESVYNDSPPPTSDPLSRYQNGEHIDLEAAVAEASDLPVSANELEELLASTPPELRKVLEDEFSAEFFGPVNVDPDKLD